MTLAIANTMGDLAHRLALPTLQLDSHGSVAARWRDWIIGFEAHGDTLLLHVSVPLGHDGPAFVAAAMARAHTDAWVPGHERPVQVAVREHPDGKHLTAVIRLSEEELRGENAEKGLHYLVHWLSELQASC